MKLVTYQTTNEAPTVGLLIDSDRAVLPLNTLGDSPTLGSMQGLIEGGDAVLNAIRSMATDLSAALPLSDVRLLAPLPQPIQIRDVLCFLDHLRNAGRVATAMGGGDPDSYEMPAVFGEAPRYYKANRMCVVGPDHDILWPEGCNMLDYELELGIIIGKQGKNIPATEALDYVFGYTIFNDVSARDLQMAEMASGLGPAKGKDFDTGNVFGPCIVTADSVDPSNLTMIARLNGDEVSRGNTSQMDHSIAEVISYVSQNETIYPGEILGSGTVPLGCLLEHGRSLSVDDVIELEIEGIGTLRNRVVKPDSRSS